MLDKEPKHEWFSFPWLTYFFVIAFSVWGGIVNLIQRYRMAKNRRFSLTESIGELTISAFAGMVVYYICVGIKLHESLMAAFVGIAGHMGSRIIYVLECWLKEKLGGYLGIKNPHETPESPPPHNDGESR